MSAFSSYNIELSTVLKAIPFDTRLHLVKLGKDDPFEYNEYITVGEVPFRLIEDRVMKIRQDESPNTFYIELFNKEVEYET